MTRSGIMISEQPLFLCLSSDSQEFLRQQAEILHLSFQDCRKVCEIALDFQMWGGDTIRDVWPWEIMEKAAGKLRKKQVVSILYEIREQKQFEPNYYPKQSLATEKSSASIPCSIEKESLGLGRCPVASERTLCCNLQTLDAVDNCGYGCSYCSIQSFFDGKQITFDQNFGQKLNQLKINSDKTYHIGTGQSSDSLMWGNSHGVLDSLVEFANKHPNVILELKTKSANISHFLKAQAPKNILCTWSINAETIIKHEEHGTASLEKRIESARKVADNGHTVGFHFHPIVHFEGWQDEYHFIVDRIQSNFNFDEVALVSMGTLTYIKPVIRQIRNSAIPSQILKMPLVDADGKLSYPDDIKLELFRHVYNSFTDDWKESVFFYLCMENQRFWKPVFGFNYSSNTEFETAMKQAYLNKIRRK